MKWDFLKGCLIATVTATAAWFDSTLTFLEALMVGFLFNVLAGFRADAVHFKMVRLIPPKFMTNFNGNKFKDSLMELFLITSITYVLKGFIDLLSYDEKSAYVVQFLMAVAIYFYFRNGLRNLHKVYPEIKFITVIYFLVAFEFRKLVGNDVADAIDKAEKEDKLKEDL